MSKGHEECPCQVAPLESRCGDWEGNTSACPCADTGVAMETGQPLPG